MIKSIIKSRRHKLKLFKKKNAVLEFLVRPRQEVEKKRKNVDFEKLFLDILGAQRRDTLFTFMIRSTN